MNVSLIMKWKIIDVSRTSYSIDWPGRNLHPITIFLEEPFTEEKLKLIDLCKTNLEKVNKMPAEGGRAAAYVEKKYKAKRGA